ncbi:hypothetical protein B0H17DRAFT_649484 [Mycena rosella]|uniref:Uncharacterized protein n=1 Tax=Mycena rosella TaxID=1033263 RepID=A0AAD7GH34_MYCRO|nr:hypothetical protein B0H17DRAFT_649484 [Mycena rosella]
MNQQSTVDPPVRRAREYMELTHDRERATEANVDMGTIELRAEDLYDKERSTSRHSLLTTSLSCFNATKLVYPQTR